MKPEQVRRPADAFIGFAACGITGENQNCDFPVAGIPVRKSIGCFRRCKSVLNFCCAVSRKDTVDFYCPIKIKQNEETIYPLTVMLLGVSTWSCSYDDDDLWNEIGNIKTELARINKEVGTLQTLVDALNQQKRSPLSKKRRRGTRLPSTMAKPSKLKRHECTGGRYRPVRRRLLLDDRRQRQLADRCGREQNPCRRQGRLETPNGRRCRRLLDCGRGAY